MWILEGEKEGEKKKEFRERKPMIRLNDTVFSRENFYEMHCNY